jgi:O-methyltransferase
MKMKYRVIGFLKGMLLFTRIGLVFGFMRRPLQFSYNLIGLARWIRSHGSKASMNDFYRLKRSYHDRENLYQHVIRTENMADEPVHYLEFGVCSGNSFKWWMTTNTNPQSAFWGFDTFEGLPEGWFLYKKGDMNADVPQLPDARGEFVKGLFQQTLPGFLDEKRDFFRQSQLRKIIHLDADLFSSTVYVLTSLAPFLREGDILLFDEFNVPNHEFAAWEIFVNSFYVDYEVLGAVNNYYQIAVKYKGMAVFK